MDTSYQRGKQRQIYSCCNNRSYIRITTRTRQILENTCDCCKIIIITQIWIHIRSSTGSYLDTYVYEINLAIRICERKSKWIISSDTVQACNNIHRLIITWTFQNVFYCLPRGKVWLLYEKYRGRYWGDRPPHCLIWNPILFT